MAKRFKWHRYIGDRTFAEKVLRRFTIPVYDSMAFTSEEWRKRNARLKRMFPVRWFFHDTVGDLKNDYVVRPYRSVRQWIRFRTWDKYHVLKMEVEPGYMDPDERILQSSFQILKDYVEIELSSMHLAGEEAEAGEPIRDHLARFSHFFRKAKKRNERNVEAGLAYLDWEIEDENCAGSQADAAREKKDLYLWWTKERSHRFELYSDPHLGWDPNDSGDPFDNTDRSRQYALLRKAEEFYEAQDEEMLIRLMKIRKSLWI